MDRTRGLVRAIATLALVALCGLAAVQPALASPRPASAASPAAHVPSVVPALDPRQGKSHLVQDPTWLAAKLAFKVNRPGSRRTATATGLVGQAGPAAVTPGCVYPCPSASFSLDTSSTQNVLEPRGDVTQSGGGYNSSDGQDRYNWGLCGPGATAVALYYWGNPTFSYPAGPFTDPHTTSSWNDTNGRAYIMYLATRSNPPAFNGNPGEEAYHTYPGDETYVPDVVSVLNYEANTTFYSMLWYTQFNQSQMHADVVDDLWYNFVPVVIDVNAQKLTNWVDKGTYTHHFIAIIGYDDGYNNGAGPQYKYIDTCGPSCNNSGKAGGVYSINQTTLYNAIQNNQTTGALIW